MSESLAPRLVPGLHFKKVVYGLWPEDDLPERHVRAELRSHVCPRNGRRRIRDVFGPAAIEIGALLFGQH